MKELIEVLTIFMKYQEEGITPIGCGYQAVCIMGVGENDLSEEDKKRVEELKFYWDDEVDCWSTMNVE